MWGVCRTIEFTELQKYLHLHATVRPSENTVISQEIIILITDRRQDYLSCPLRLAELQIYLDELNRLEG